MGDNDKTIAYVKAAAGVLIAGLILWAHSGAAAKCCDKEGKGCGTKGNKCC